MRQFLELIVLKSQYLIPEASIECEKQAQGQYTVDVSARIDPTQSALQGETQNAFFNKSNTVFLPRNSFT